MTDWWPRWALRNAEASGCPAAPTVPPCAYASAPLSGRTGERWVRNVAEPMSGSDAVNKSYVDGLVRGLAFKQPVRAVDTSTAFLADRTPDSVVDGVRLGSGDRVLFAALSDARQNGIYVFAADIFSRSADLAVGASAAGVYVFVTEGTTYHDCGFLCSNDAGEDFVGRDELRFERFAESPDYSQLALLRRSNVFSRPVGRWFRPAPLIATQHVFAHGLHNGPDARHVEQLGGIGGHRWHRRGR